MSSAWNGYNKYLKPVLFLANALVASCAPMSGQASPAAIKTLSATVGVTYSRFAPDYGPGHLQGFAVFADVNSLKRLGFEALARRVDLATPHNIEQDYLIGPTYRPTWGRFSPYVKLLGGVGLIRYQPGDNASFVTQHYGVVAYGGGLDLSISPHIVLRVGDFEAERWPHFPQHGLTPYGVSTGLEYAF